MFTYEPFLLAWLIKGIEKLNGVLQCFKILEVTLCYLNKYFSPI
jgi:hypothetical protein